MNKFFIITYAKNNKQFKTYLKKSKNSVLISYEDIQASNQKYTVFQEEQSDKVLETDVYAKINTSIKNMLTNKRTPCFFIYYYVSRVDEILFDSLIDEVSKKINYHKVNDVIKTHICFLPIEDISKEDLVWLNQLKKDKNLKLLEKIISLKKS